MAGDLATPVEQKVDVFLCHAGEQKDKIVSHLQKALHRSGFTVFLDKDNMVMGQYADETISPALKKASAVVIVLSLDFVGKYYPMKELDWALQHRDRIVPVLYDITRTACKRLLDADADRHEEVRRILGKLQEYTQDWNTLQKYKQDLREVAKLGNIDPKDSTTPMTESQLVDAVIQEVRKVTGQPCLSLPQYPVGLHGQNGRVQDLVQLVANGGVLGLFGEGGIGKTTLINAVFNVLAGQFPRDCAVCEVGMDRSSSHLLACANNVLQELGGLEVSALGRVRGLLKEQRVLLLLDNLWHKEQVEQLVEPLMDGLHAGSIVLCTSRSDELLCGIKRMQSREVHGLEESAARCLFNWHAFGPDDADLELPPGIRGLSAQVLEVCARVPLALEVAGSYIFRQKDRKFEQSMWVAALASLNSVRGGVMERILGLSLECLCGNAAADTVAVYMFYDVACFLRGEREAKAVAAWSGVYDDNLIEATLYDLKSLNLCKLDSEGRLTMHDLICQLGRTKTLHVRAGAEQWSNQEWLWDDDKGRAFNALLKGKVSASVRTLQLRQRDLGLVKVIPSLGCLKFLRLQGCWGCKTLGSFPGGLVWLHCEAVDWASLPNCAPLQDLRVLHLRECQQLQDMSNGITGLSRLQVLDLAGCGQIPALPGGISALTDLQSLNLWRCSKLRSIPEGISCLTSLKLWDLSECSQLSSLPEGISSLISLEALKLWRCSQLSSIPEGISCLTALKTLDLSECTQLSSIPEGISRLISLQALKSWRCSHLSSIPDSVSCLTGLRTLDLSECSQLSSLHGGISCLTGLHMLSLRGWGKLSSLPEGISCLTSLTSLSLSECSQLSSLPEGFSCLTGLQRLKLWRCSQLSSVPEGFSCLTGLRIVDMSECSQLSFPQGMTYLTGLQELKLWRCGHLSSSILDGICCWSSLRVLHLTLNSKLSSLPESISCLTGLQTLDLSESSQLGSMQECISSLTGLQALKLWMCSKLSSLPEGTSCLTGLRTLDLSECSQLSSLPEGISRLTSLKKLKLWRCSNLSSLPDGISCLTSLKVLDLSECSQLCSLPEAVSRLTGLQVLGADAGRKLKC